MACNHSRKVFNLVKSCCLFVGLSLRLSVGLQSKDSNNFSISKNHFSMLANGVKCDHLSYLFLTLAVNPQSYASARSPCDEEKYDVMSLDYPESQKMNLRT